LALREGGARCQLLAHRFRAASATRQAR
jgi:hypothetical protein